MAYEPGSYLIRPIMTAASGLIEDQIVNDWVVRTADTFEASEAELEDAMAHVGDFYRLGATSADRVGSYIGDQVDRGATHEIVCYQIVEGPLGPPTHGMSWLGPTTGNVSKNLPTEVAGVLSFHASLDGVYEEVGATRPRARRRGRIFVGPLNEDAITDAPAPVLSTVFTAAMRSNATVMYDALQADGFEWCVWSRADIALREVVGGWTDDAPDTQRRRGQASTARTVFTTI